MCAILSWQAFLSPDSPSTQDLLAHVRPSASSFSKKRRPDSMVVRIRTLHIQIANSRSAPKGSEINDMTAD